MADTHRTEAARPDEEKLAHALVSRGLLSREELLNCKPVPGGATGPQALLERLVGANLLTPGQARRAAHELPALLGQQIPGYLLMEKLGTGSMGTVYKARQLSMNRLVAIKVLHAKLAANKGFLDRFTREAHLAAKLSHNNVIQAIDVGSAGNMHYFVMELVEGKTIRDELDEGKVYDEREAVDIVLQVAQALGHAARRGLVHRDVKPANIVLTAEGIAKLADLGLARGADDRALAIREKGLAIGTPYYMAPEQVEGRTDVDTRADVYSLGATLYHMVTGQPPFPDKDVDAVLEAHLEKELTPPDHLNANLSAGLGEVVECMMAKDRRRRYRSADDLVIDLECLFAGEAPKLARQRLAVQALKGLEEGDSADEGGDSRSSGPGWVWVAVLGGLLALSAVVNLVLLLRRGS